MDWRRRTATIFFCRCYGRGLSASAWPRPPIDQGTQNRFAATRQQYAHQHHQQSQQHCHYSVSKFNSISNSQTQQRDRQQRPTSTGIRRRKGHNADIDPARETNRLIGILKAKEGEKEQQPVSLIENQLFALLRHLAIHNEKNGGPMASRLFDAVRASPIPIKRSVQLFELTIQCWINSGVDGAAKTAYQLLRSLLNQGEVLLLSDMDPDDIDRVNCSFALVVHTLLKDVDRIDRVASNDDESRLVLKNIDSLIGKIQTLYNRERCGLKPNTAAMNAILNTLCHSNNSSSGTTALELLQSMIDDVSLEPNENSFAIVMHHLCKLGDIDGAKELLISMSSMYADGTISCEANVSCYNAVLDGLSKTKSKLAAKQIETILSEMESIGGNLRPDAVSYTSCIHAYATLGNAEVAELIFNRMLDHYEAGNASLRPDATALGACVNAWAQFGGVKGAERAEALVSLQEELYREGNAEGFAPTLILYNSVLNAWARTNSKGGAEEALNVLERMKRYNIEPNTFTISTLFTALARSKLGNEAIEKADHLLQEVDNGRGKKKPINVICYNAYLHCLAKNGAKNVAERIEHTLSRMEKEGIRPNVSTMNTAISMLANSGEGNSGSEASKLLQTMETSTDENLKPNARTYGALINAWSMSSEPNRAEMAFQIYKKMKVPTTMAANALLKACCFLPVAERESAVKIAFAVMKEAASSGDIIPDSVTYSTMLKVIGTGMPPGGRRDEYIKALFQQCCADGMVNGLVLKTLSRSFSSHLFNELVPTRNGSHSLPGEYSRNANARNS